MFDKKIVFNASLPRSGSTLMQNILAQNPRFYCTPTSAVLDLMIASRKYYTDLAEFKAQDPELMHTAFTSYCRYALHGFFDGITDKPVCIDKCRSWFHYHDWLTQFHPNPKYVVCIRDLRSILSSMEKLFRKKRHLADNDEVTGTLTMITVNNRVMRWLNGPPVGVAVARLVESLQTGVIKYMHIVRFEDLTTHPEETMRRVYNYLEEPYFAHDFANIAQSTQENDAFHTQYGDHHIRSSIAPVPLDYNQVLGPDLSTWVKNNYGMFYNTFYSDRG